MFKLRHLPRAGPIALGLVLALVLVPGAASGTYADASGDNTAGASDIKSVSVTGDKSNGQLLFRISGANMASSDQNVLFVDIDTDANPATGNLSDGGTEYSFVVGASTFDFSRWDGANWVDTPYATVRVTGNTSDITISVNRSELANTADFNFAANTLNFTVDGTTATFGLDVAPDDGAYNYSFEANGPLINSVDVQTTPSAGPKAGKRFVVQPTALHLPPDGRTSATPLLPESYSCGAKLAGKRLVGTGTGGCTYSIPKKAKAKKGKKKPPAKTLVVQLTVNYQGATKVVPLTFKVT
jgi:hypothetical protein